MRIVTPDVLREWEKIIPTLDRLPAPPRRCILHWTGGPPRANNLDRQHYHYIFNQPSGEVVLGHNPVASNTRRVASGTPYAAHTGGFNSFSVGFAFAGMLNASPGRRFGTVPLTEVQVRSGLTFVAYCMYLWNLPVNEATLFTHYEAWAVHKVKGSTNHTKWDINELQFAPHLNKDQVGPWLREVTRNHIGAIRDVRERGPRPPEGVDSTGFRGFVSKIKGR